MADEVKEFSREEAQGTLFHGAPQPSVMAPVVQRAVNIPVPPPLSVKSVEKGTPVAKQPDALSLVKRVSEAQKELQASVEAPKPPSAMGGLVDELVANWKPLAIGAGVVATGMAAKRYLGRKEPAAPTVKVEPSFATAEETATFKPIEQPAAPSKLALESEAKFGVPLSDVEKHFDVKITNLKDAEILSNSYKNSLPQGMIPGIPTGQPNVSSNPAGAFSQAPNYSPAPPAPQGGFDPARIGQPLQDPLAGRGYQTPVQDIGPRAPSVGEAVATGGNVDQAIKQTVANQLDTTAPQGMRENYKRSKTEPIGPGAFNHLANNVGLDNATKIWQEVYGQKNVPYAEYMAQYSKAAGKEMQGPVRPLAEGAKPGGSFGTPKYIPEYIKGSASPQALMATAAASAIPALAAAGYQAYKGNKEKVDAELKDAWESMKSVVTMPIDVAKAAGKGNFGPFKDLLMSMNPGTLLMNEANKRDEAAIQRMIQAEKVGAGRGIAPPSAYQR